MPRTPTQNRAELMLFHSIRSALLAFPIDLNLRSAQFLGWMWGKLVPKARQRAVNNLAEAFGEELSPAQIERLAVASMQNMAMTGIELLQAPRLVDRWTWPRYAELNNIQKVLELAVGQRGAILVSGHFGNFELLGQLMACFFGNFAAVMRPLNNPLVNEHLVAARRHTGLELIAKKGAVRVAEARLREGHLVGFVPDQDAGSSGIFVNFFGRPASTFKTVAVLACQHEVPVVVGYCRRMGRRFRHELGVEQVIRPDEWQNQDDPVHWITQTYTTAIERVVRRYPEQYLWTHRRWKTRPPAELRST